MTTGAALFTDDFLSVDAQTIQQAIRTDGFFSMPRALRLPAIDAMLRDVEENRFAVNRNWVGGVYSEYQYYLCHMLACSRTFTQFATHPKVFEICDALLSSDYRLKALRYYETYGKHHMQWHTDNKTDSGFAHIPGLIFIAYMADVNDGEFQYVRASHNWSGERGYSDYSDEEIEKNHGKDVVGFKAPRGTIVIYDTYGIHRALPVASSQFVRKSVFFQVDCRLDSAEPIILNPAYLGSLDPKTVRYLGFGRPADYRVFPDTSMRHLPIGRLGLRTLGQWTAYRMARSAFNLLPRWAKAPLQMIAGRK